MHKSLEDSIAVLAAHIVQIDNFDEREKVEFGYARLDATHNLLRDFAVEIMRSCGVIIKS